MQTDSLVDVNSLIRKKPESNKAVDVNSLISEKKKNIQSGHNSGSEEENTPSTLPSPLPEQNGFDFAGSLNKAPVTSEPAPVQQPAAKVNPSYTAANNFGLTPVQDLQKVQPAKESTNIVIPTSAIFNKQKNVYGNYTDQSITDDPQDEAVKIKDAYEQQRKNILNPTVAIKDYNPDNNFGFDVAAIQKENIPATDNLPVREVAKNNLPKNDAPQPTKESQFQAQVQQNLIRLNEKTIAESGEYAAKVTNDPVAAGFITKAILGDHIAITQKNTIDKGGDVPESDLYHTGMAGLHAFDLALDKKYETDKENPEYLQQKADLAQQSTSFINRFPEYRRTQLIAAVAQKLQELHPGIVNDRAMANLYMPEIKKSMGLSDADVKSLDFDNPIGTMLNLDYPTTGFLTNVVEPIYRGSLDLAAGATRVIGSAVGADQDLLTAKINQMKTSPDEYFKDVINTNGAPIIVDTDSKSGTFLQDVKNPDAGKTNWTFQSMANGLGHGIGSLAWFIYGTKAMGGLAEAGVSKLATTLAPEAAESAGLLSKYGESVAAERPALTKILEANKVVKGADGSITINNIPFKLNPEIQNEVGMAGLMIGQGYDTYYQKANSIVSDKPEDEWKRHLFALANGTIDYLSFRVLGNVVKGMPPAAEQDIAKVLQEAPSLSAVSRKKLETVFQKALTYGKEAGKETAFVQGATAIGEAAKVGVVSLMGDPKEAAEEQRNLPNVILQGVAASPLSLFIPLVGTKVIQGVSAGRYFRENLYNAGLEPKTARGQTNKLFELGHINQDQLNDRLQVINTAEKVVNSIPKETFDALNHNQRVSYVNSKVRELALKARSANVDDAALEKYYEQQINEEVAKRTEILNGGGKEGDFPQPKDTQLSQPIEGLDKQGIPTGENVPAPTDGSVKKGNGGQEDIPNFMDEVSGEDNADLTSRVKANGNVNALISGDDISQVKSQALIRAVTQANEDAQPVKRAMSDLLNSDVVLNGERGRLRTDEENNVVFDNGGKETQLGKTTDNKFLDSDVSDHGISEVPKVEVKGNNVKIDNDNFEIVSFNKDNNGDLASVSLKDENGKVITKRDKDLALDIQKWLEDKANEEADYKEADLFKDPIKDSKYYINKEIWQQSVNDGSLEKQVNKGRDKSEIVEKLKKYDIGIPNFLTETNESENKPTTSESKTSIPTENKIPKGQEDKTVKRALRDNEKISRRIFRDAEQNKKIDDALNDLLSAPDNILKSGGLNPEKIEKSVKLIGLYIDKGVYKFGDIVEDLHARIGDKVKDLFDSLKSGYSSYYNVKATDEQADQMESNIRKHSYEKLAGNLVREEDLAKKPKANDAVSFKDKVREKLDKGEKQNINTLRKDAKELGLKKTDTELQELAELAVVEKSKEISLGKGSDEDKLDKIIDVYDNQPTISMRSSERIAKQQYSTPIPLSFIAGKYLGKEGTVLEPNAGNGAMTVYFDPKRVQVNEIDPTRLENLQEQGFAKVTDQDATKPLDIKPVDGLIMNPPFGSAPEKSFDGYKVKGLDEQMIINSLESLKDNGKAAIIMGGHNSYDEKGRLKADRTFFNYLYNHYNVDGVLNIDGDLYKKQGTSFPIRMILIDGRKETPEGNAPLKSPDEKTFDDFKDIYNYINNKNEKENNLQSNVDANGDNGNVVYGRSSADSENINEKGSPNISSQSDTGIDKTSGEAERASGAADRGYSGLRPSEQNKQSAGNDKSDNEQQPVSDVRKSLPGDKKTRARVENAGSSGIIPDDNPVPIPAKSFIGDINKEKVTYKPKSEGRSVDTVIPTQMATETERVLSDIASAYGNIDNFVTKELGYKNKEELYKSLSAEQIDATAMAINQLENGGGMIIGDQTGVGKGRIAAAVIRYAVNKGKIPIFLTEKPNLFSDLYRDLVNIKSENLNPFIVNDKSADNDPTITDESGKVVHKVLSSAQKKNIFSTGKLPPDTNFILTTYSQFRSSPNRPSIKKDFFKQIAQGNIIIMDESHNVSGDSNSGKLFQDVLKEANGVVYLSATFAKRPDNMPVYAMRTSMNEANMSHDELISAIEKGGVALQEVVSSQLVESGQMIRRERSFEGVNVDYDVLHKSEVVHREVADKVTDIVRNVIDFQRDYVTPIISKLDDIASAEGERVEGRKGVSMAGVDNQPFASKVFNVIDQLLFSIKAKDVAQAAIGHLKAGRKPVIGFKSTMESFLKNEGFSEGEKLDKHDFTLSLKRGLDGVLRYTEKNSKGDAVYKKLDLADLSEDGRKAYNAILSKISKTSVDISISPIDVMRKELMDAGYTVGEITGRNLILDIQKDGTAIVTKRSGKDVKKIARDFNNGNGEADVILLNASGATGISLHSSDTFKDKRPRVLISGQLELDINKEVQKRGRIDRTGQTSRGAYQYIVSSIPAESRLLMMFKQKLKSLDANTTSSQKSKGSDVAVTDFLNKYGDEIVTDYLKENPTINAKLLDPLKFGDKSQEDLAEITKVEDAAKKVTGRVAILPTKEQEAFYKSIAQRYVDHLEYLNSNNANDLEVKTLNLDAKTLSKKTIIVGKGGVSPFGADSVLESIEANVLKKPLKKAEIESEIKKYTDNKPADEYSKDQVDKLNDHYEKYIDEQVKDIISNYDKKKKDAAEKIKSKGGENVQEDIQDSNRNLEYARDSAIQMFEDKQNVLSGSIERNFKYFQPGKTYMVPTSVNINTNTSYSKGVFVGYDIKDDTKNIYSPSNIKMRFAVNDGRRVITLPMSKQNFLNAIISNSQYAPRELRDTGLDKWDATVSTKTREKRNIITGNLLQAYGTNDGQLVAYTNDKGELKKGLLLPEGYNPTDQKVRVPINKAQSILEKNGYIVSSNSEVEINKQYDGEYKLTVPLSRSVGGKYFLDDSLRDLVDNRNFEQRGTKMVGYFPEEKLSEVLSVLQDKHSLSVETKSGFQEGNVNFDILEKKLDTDDPLKKEKAVIQKYIQYQLDNNKTVTLDTILKHAEDKGLDPKKYEKAYHELVQSTGFKGEGNQEELTKPMIDKIEKGVSKLYGKEDGYVQIVKNSDELEKIAKEIDGRYQVDGIYHGSPHSFDRFTTDKMGTGEGAQAFDIKLDGKNTTTNIEGFVSDFMAQYVGATPDINTLKKVSGRLLDNGQITKKEYDIIQSAKSLEVKPNRNLYEVLLHEGKTPEQYDWLVWDKPVSENFKNKIKTQSDKEGLKVLKVEEFGNERNKANPSLLVSQKYSNDLDGANLYQKLKDYFGSDKAASEFLLRAGIDGIKYPAESIARGATSDNARGFNYVVFDENAVSIKNRVQFQRNDRGEILGITDPTTGKIYLNGEHLNPNTPVHEAGHLWAEWAKTNNPDVYDRGIKLINKPEESTYLQEVSANKFYTDEALKVGDKGTPAYNEYLQHEALAKAIGDKGAQFITEARRKTFTEWAKELWRIIGEKLGFKGVKPEQLENMSLKEFTERAARDILMGEPAKGEKVEDNSGGKEPPSEAVGSSTEGGRLSGITHAATSETRERLSLPEYEKTVRTDAELNTEADQKIKEGYDAEGLVKKIQEGHLPTDVENTILKKYKAVLEAKVDSDPSDENINKLYQLVKASDAIGSEQGRALRSRQGMDLVDDSLGGYFVREMDATNVDKLTEEQKVNIQKEYENIKAANEELTQKVADLEARQSESNASEKVLRIRSKTPGKTKKSHEDFQKERQEIISHLRQQLKRARTETSAVAIPYAKELFYAAPDVAKLVKSLVEEGITKLADVVDNVHGILQESIPAITKKDVHDIIAGEYNPKQKTKSEITATLRDLKDEARLVNKLSALLNGEEPKEPKKKIERNRNIKVLTDQIKEIQKKKRLQDKEDNTFYTQDILSDYKKLKTFKDGIDKRTKDLEKDLADGNILQEPSKKKSILDDKELQKKYPELYKQTLDAKDKLIKLKTEREIRLLKEQYANRSKTQKVKDFLTNILNTPRTIMASVDYSAPLRQGIIASVSHPIIASKAFIEMFKQSVSQKRFDRWHYDLEQTPEYDIMKRSDLYIADPHNPVLTAKEEQFMNNLAEKIPVIGKLIKGSERAYTAYLNKLRVDIFKNGIDAFQAEGKTLENSQDLYKAFAGFVNNATGRGNLGKLEGSAQSLNVLFFSPRLIAARLNMLNPVYYAKLPKEIRIKALLSMAKFVGLGLSVIGLMQLNKDVEVEKDPRSTDFGKIKLGETRWDIWGGFQQYIRFFGQMFSGQKKSTITGEINDMGKKYGSATRFDNLIAFARGKLSPVPAEAASILSGKSTIGQPLTIKGEALNLLQPLLFQDIEDAYKTQGAKSIATIGLPSIFGVGVQTQLKNVSLSDADRKDPTLKYYVDKDIELPSLDLDSEIPHSGGKSISDYPKEKQEAYIKKQSDIFKYNLREIKSKGVVYVDDDGNVSTKDDESNVYKKPKSFSKLTPVELRKVLTLAQSKATRRAKEIIFNVKY